MSEKQISDTKKIIQIFELSLNKIEEGKGKEIKVEKLPKEIDYEFIYGMSTKERNERFNQVLKKLKQDELKDKNKLKNEIEEKKKIPPSQFKKNQKKFKETLDELKENVLKDEFYYKIYNEAYKNKWCPAPILEEIEEEEKFIKEEKTIPENTLLIKINEIKGLDVKKKYKIELLCQYDSENTLKDEIKGKPQNIVYEKQISLEKNRMKFLIKKSLILKLIEISFIFMCCKKENEIGYLEIYFKDFISQNTIESDFEFNDIKRKKKKIGISIKVSLKIRKALGEEEYDINVKTSKEIMRVFQPFKGDPIENYDVPSSNYIKNYIPKKTITNQTVTNNNKNNAQNTQMKKNNTQKKEKPKIEGVTYTKDDFTEEELEDPTNTDIIVTAKSLEFEIKKLDEKCAKIEGRIPKELRDKKIK